MTLRIETLTGAALAAALDDVARLRIEVFRAWPYLYDGDLAYERDYLQSYRDSAGAVVVGAFDADRLVGAATGTPLADHADDFAAAFAQSTLDMADIFYCAESVLLPAYRGQGAGHGFFDAREAHARALGFAKSAFCSVIRPKEHPLHPTGYTPLDPFWRKRGYRPLPGVVAEFAWKDIDQPKETTKTLQFWLRDL
ncbi:GNAT family N-acetyltransferase [Tritonibacter mobilis]|uniref:GNAT family acetyltransferase n=1 Tax=Tritonibacter mobilis F1926 TaxID=1265309 RepID=A0A1B1A7I3_9RHOB|nr:GNAT family N-acetyltransferase [Tritonibacter mobilis]ANP42535.1 GNAT family acetyltransferase [Tritonibacter mobilis F1926]KJZ21939.1 GNAT family acetyltransferase [Tritonibacter mobilis]